MIRASLAINILTPCLVRASASVCQKHGQAVCAGSSSSSEAMDHGSVKSSPRSSASLSNSFVVIPQLQHNTPILWLQYDEHRAQEAQQEGSSKGIMP